MGLGGAPPGADAELEHVPLAPLPPPLHLAAAPAADTNSSAPSEPASSLLLHDGCTLLDDGSPHSSAGGLRSGGICRLAAGATAEESAEGRHVQHKLMAALCLAFAFMLVEVVGGIYSGSLAIITDAAHLLSDVSGFAVAALAAHWARRAASAPFTWGYHRVEVLGALVSVMAVWVVTAMLLLEAVQRVIRPEPVDGKVMFIIAAVGVGCNALMMLVLGHHHHGHACSHSHGPALDHAHSHSSDDESQCGKAAAADTKAALGSGGCCGGLQHHHSHAHSSHKYAALDLELGPPAKLAPEEPQQGGVDSALLPILQAAGFVPPPPSSSPKAPAPLIPRGATRSDVPAHAHACGTGCSHSHGRTEQIHLHAHTPAAAGGCGHAHGHSHSSSHGHGHGHNMNMRGAIIHVIGDFVQSIGVCIAGALIWYHQDDPRWALADPVCTFLFAALVLWTTKTITADIFTILMERAPPGVDPTSLHAALAAAPGVACVDDLHVWALTPGIPLLAAHVRLAPGADAAAVLRQLEGVCAAAGIAHATIQPVL